MKMRIIYSFCYGDWRLGDCGTRRWILAGDQKAVTWLCRLDGDLLLWSSWYHYIGVV